MRHISGLLGAIIAATIGHFPHGMLDVVSRRSSKTGRTYPHSSKRQQARYARQIAKGQLQMARV